MAPATRESSAAQRGSARVMKSPPGGPNLPRGAAQRAPAQPATSVLTPPRAALPLELYMRPDSEAWECTEDCGGGAVPAEETSAIVV